MSPNTKNTIKFDNLKFFAYHGLYDKEIKEGQNFFIDLKISYDLLKYSDTISSTIDYMDMYETIKSSFFEKRFNLLESLAKKIIEDLTDKYNSIYYIKINLRKPEIKIDSNVNFISLEVEHNR